MGFTLVLRDLQRQFAQQVAAFRRSLMEPIGHGDSLDWLATWSGACGIFCPSQGVCPDALSSLRSCVERCAAQRAGERLGELKLNFGEEQPAGAGDEEVDAEDSRRAEELAETRSQCQAVVARFDEQVGEALDDIAHIAVNGEIPGAVSMAVLEGLERVLDSTKLVLPSVNPLWPAGDVKAAMNQEIQKLRNFIAGQFSQQAELLQSLSRQVERGGKSVQMSSKADVHTPNGVAPTPPLSPLSLPKRPEDEPKSEGQEQLFASDTSREATEHVLSNDTQKSKDRRQSLGSDGLQSLTMDSDKLDLGSDAEARQQRKMYAAAAAATGQLSTEDDDQQKREVNWRDPKDVAKYLTRHSVFIYGIMGVILFNLISLGIEVDIAARDGSDKVPIWFDYMNMFVVFIFVVELSVNFVANGPWGFCCGADRLWNFFDLVIVALSVIETVVSFMANAAPQSQVSPSHLRFMRPIRLARALRGVRVMRLFRYVGALRTLLLSIMSSIASLFWTIVLLVLLFYSFGVLVTQLVSDHCEFQPPPVDGSASSFACRARGDELSPYFYTGPSRYWSSVGEAMLTLFMAISGGIDWDDGLTPLRDIPIAMVALILYIIITAPGMHLQVEHEAIESAAADKDIAVMKQMRKQAAQVQVLRHVFQEINSHHTDTISMQDLQDAMGADKLSSFFESMGISTGDVWTLFKVIDTDGSGAIDMEEFERHSSASLRAATRAALAVETLRTLSDLESAKTSSRVGEALRAASTGEIKLAKKAEAIIGFLNTRSEEVNCVWARLASVSGVSRSSGRSISSLGHFWKLADDEVGPACGWGSAAFAAKAGESSEAKSVSVPIQTSPFVFERLAASSKQIFELSGAQGPAAVATAAAAKASLAELFAAAYEAERPSDLARLKRSGMSHLLQWLFDLSFLRIALSAAAAPGAGAYESLRELLTKVESVTFSDPVDRLLYQDVLKASVSNHVQGTKVLLAPFFLHNPLYGYLSQSCSGTVRSNSKPALGSENEGFELQTTFTAPLRPVLPRFPLLPVAMNVTTTSDLERLRLDPPARKAEPKAASSLMQQAGGLVGSGLGTLKFGAALFTGKPGALCLSTSTARDTFAHCIALPTAGPADVRGLLQCVASVAFGPSSGLQDAGHLRPTRWRVAQLSWGRYASYMPIHPSNGRSKPDVLRIAEWSRGSRRPWRIQSRSSKSDRKGLPLPFDCKSTMREPLLIVLSITSPYSDSPAKKQLLKACVLHCSAAATAWKP
eukprot:s531_g7.t1